MQEQRITFETAKLAKEREFDIDCGWKLRKLEDGSFTHTNCTDLGVEQPTQSLLQKWLREVHHIYITLFPEDNEDKSKTWVSKLYTLNFGSDAEVSYLKHSGNSSSYEDALEIGLQEALKLLPTCS